MSREMRLVAKGPFVGFFLLLFGMATARDAVAGLTPAVELTESMMAAEANDAAFIGRFSARPRTRPSDSRSRSTPRTNPSATRSYRTRPISEARSV